MSKKGMTIILSGMPTDLTVQTLATNLDRLFDTDDIGTFRIRELPPNSMWQYALDFKTTYDAFSAQSILDGYRYTLTTGEEYRLVAKINNKPKFETGAGPLIRSSFVEPIMDDYALERCNRHLDAHLKLLKKQKLILQTEREILLEKKQLEKEWKKKHANSDSEDEKIRKSAKRSKKSRHPSRSRSKSRHLSRSKTQPKYDEEKGQTLPSTPIALASKPLEASEESKSLVPYASARAATPASQGSGLTGLQLESISSDSEDFSRPCPDLREILRHKILSKSLDSPRRSQSPERMPLSYRLEHRYLYPRSRRSSRSPQHLSSRSHTQSRSPVSYRLRNSPEHNMNSNHCPSRSLDHSMDSCKCSECRKYSKSAECLRKSSNLRKRSDTIPEKSSSFCGLRSSESPNRSVSGHSKSHKTSEHKRSRGNPEQSRSRITPEHSRTRRTPEHSRSRRTPEHSRSRRTPEHLMSRRSPDQLRSHITPEQARLHRCRENSRSRITPEHTRTRRTPENTRSRRTPEHSRSRRTPEHLMSRRSPEQLRSHITPQQARLHRSGENSRSRRTPEQSRSHRSREDLRSRRTPEQSRKHSSKEDSTSRRSPEQLRSHRNSEYSRSHRTPEHLRSQRTVELSRSGKTSDSKGSLTYSKAHSASRSQRSGDQDKHSRLPCPLGKETPQEEEQTIVTEIILDSSDEEGLEHKEVDPVEDNFTRELSKAMRHLTTQFRVVMETRLEEVALKESQRERVMRRLPMVVKERVDTLKLNRYMLENDVISEYKLRHSLKDDIALIQKLVDEETVIEIPDDSDEEDFREGEGGSRAKETTDGVWGIVNEVLRNVHIDKLEDDNETVILEKVKDESDDDYGDGFGDHYHRHIIKSEKVDHEATNINIFINLQPAAVKEVTDYTGVTVKAEPEDKGSSSAS